METTTLETPVKTNARSLKPRSTRDKEIASQMWKSDQVARKIAAFTGLPIDELRDAAREYIVKIHSSWEPDKGANFSTWVNRCLHYHMLNYLRDRSRLIRIPRSYSDLYLRMRKHIRAKPDIKPFELAEILNAPLDKVTATLGAYSMKFSSNTERDVPNAQSDIEQMISTTDPKLEDCFGNYKDLLYRISALDQKDEAFLVDYIVKKRAVKTMLRKYPTYSSKQELQEHADQLIKKILFDEDA
jgi:DNA-directed RNA polymerase specialized sigma24 family protein